MKFLQKVQPKQTVISCGKQNRYGHPHLETIHRLQTYRTKIYRTDRSGAINFFQKKRWLKIFQKKGILSKAIERDAKNMKKILEDIKTNTYERFLSILRGRKIYDLPDEKPVKESISFRR